MSRNAWKLLTLAVLFLAMTNIALLVFVLQSRAEPATLTSAPTPTPFALPNNREAVRVVRVIDGDTIEIENGERVRYLGIDTPESDVNPNLSSPEFYGPEATEFNRQLVEGKIVYLEPDQTDRDHFGRLLRWIFLEDGTLVEAEMVRLGYAFVNIIPPDDRYADLLRDLEFVAREQRRGVWSEFKPIAGGSGTVAPTPTTAPAATPAPATPTSTGACDPSLVPGAIGPEEAYDVVDQTATIVFRVVSTYNSGKAVFLNSHDPYQGYFYVVIFPDRWQDFPEPPETYLLDRCIAIQGRVQLYKGTPQIVLRDTIQLAILDGE
nr:thermonuclease family protein [Ardenticatena sp.]